MKKHISIWVLLLMIVAGLHAQSKEELQKLKQKAFDEIKLARELMETTSKKQI